MRRVRLGNGLSALGAVLLAACSAPDNGGPGGTSPAVSENKPSGTDGSVAGPGSGNATGVVPNQPAGAKTGETIITTQVETDGGSPATCGADTYKAERVGVNLYLLVDVSGSMLVPIGVTEDGESLISRWSAVSGAIRDFIGSPESDGLELALGYYPIHEPRELCPDLIGQCAAGYACLETVCDISLGIFGVTQPCVPALNLDDDDCLQDVELSDGTLAREQCAAPGGCSGDPTRLCFLDDNCAVGETCSAAAVAICPGETSCEVADYSTPAVERTALPNGADLMLASLDATEPDSFSATPTHVALHGAYATVASWIASDTDRRSVVVLATDGDPNGCASTDALGEVVPELDDTIDSLAAASADGIQTFVIGVLDPELTDLQPGQVDYVAEARAKLMLMAEAGGAGDATLVTSDDTTATRFLEALARIRGSVLPCEFKIPEGTGGAMFDKLNVEVTQAGSKSVLPKVDSDAACGTGVGWYYDSDVDGVSSDPTHVVLCPTSCSGLGEGEDTTVDILLGCNTVIAQQL